MGSDKVKVKSNDQGVASGGDSEHVSHDQRISETRYSSEYRTENNMSTMTNNTNPTSLILYLTNACRRTTMTSPPSVTVTNCSGARSVSRTLYARAILRATWGGIGNNPKGRLLTEPTVINPSEIRYVVPVSPGYTMSVWNIYTLSPLLVYCSVERFTLARNIAKLYYVCFSFFGHAWFVTWIWRRMIDCVNTCWQSIHRRFHTRAPNAIKVTAFIHYVNENWWNFARISQNKIIV